VNVAMLIDARMRPRWYRYVVSIPAAWFVAGTAFAIPWAAAVGLGFEPVGLWIPYVAGALGVQQSLRTKPSEVDLYLDGSAVPPSEEPRAARRHPPGTERVERPLTVVQITDPHLGPFMSVERLQRICNEAVEAEPDLILLTGDFLTMESRGTPDALAAGLKPLRVYKGRTFACFGNHDHEAPDVVRQGLASTGVQLLVDEAVVIDTDAGPVDLLGLDFRWRERRKHITKVCEMYPRTPGAIRLVMLHDPSAFKHVPDGEADLVLSGHTHGGQVGFLSVGRTWTFLRLFTAFPDHGFWALGRNRLYVHRGTGHYGFPLRVGVPSEESILRIHYRPRG